MTAETSRRLLLQSMAATSFASAIPTNLCAQEAFYTGKTIRLIVGTGAGAGYDLIARMLAEHMPRFILGTPRIVVENMVGAGSLVMANYLANRLFVVDQTCAHHRSRRRRCESA